MIKLKHAGGLLAAGTLALFGLPQIASATIAACQTGVVPNGVMSCATGVYVNLSVLSLVGVGVGPVDNVFETAPPAYAVSQTLASLDSTTVLITNVLGGTAAGLTVKTGVITDSASSPYNGGADPLATATSTVNGLSIALDVSGIQVLGIGSLGTGVHHTGATTLTSTSTASRSDGGLVQTLTGTSSIENLSLTVAGVPITLAASITAAPNTELLPVADDLLGLDVIANYQQPLYYDGLYLNGIETAALAVEFNNYLLDGDLLNGEILIADSAASVPETSTWAMMLAGLGLVGLAIRRRRTLALA